MPHVSQRASSAKKTTISTSRRRATKRTGGTHRPASTRRAQRPARTPAAPPPRPRVGSRVDRSTLRGAINKALRALLKRLAAAPALDGSGTGPAALARLVLGALVVMLEHADGEHHEAHRRAALAFAEAVRASGGAGAGGPPTSRSPRGVPPSGGQDDGRGPRRPPCRPAAAYLRAIGFECDPTSVQPYDAPLPDLIPMLFRGESDPVLGILGSIARDTTIISIALRDEENDIRSEIDMALHVIGERARVAAAIYNRIPVAKDTEGGRS